MSDKKYPLKQVMRFYIGCEVSTEYGPDAEEIKTLEAVGRKQGYELACLLDGETTPREHTDVFMQLHLLSEMPKHHLIELVGLVYETVFNYIPEPNTLKEIEILIENEYSIGLICIDDTDGRIGFTVDVKRGIEFSHNSSKLMVDQFQCIEWLTARGYDLFYLVENDQAFISKTPILPGSEKLVHEAAAIPGAAAAIGAGLPASKGAVKTATAKGTLEQIRFLHFLKAKTIKSECGKASFDCQVNLTVQIEKETKSHWWITLRTIKHPFIPHTYKIAKPKTEEPCDRGGLFYKSNGQIVFHTDTKL